MKTFKQYLTEAMENKRVVFISRGVPGSGKSSTIKRFVPEENIFSTDDFWGPNYNFDMKRLGEAHKWNLKRAMEAMSQGMTPIAIDNTNIKYEHFKPYVDFAKDNGYTVKYLEADSPWWKEISAKLGTPDFKEGNPEFEKAVDFLAKKNVHGVPSVAIKNMLKGWEPTSSLP